jgi:uncharacterized RDD family membrane protein YckC
LVSARLIEDFVAADSSLGRLAVMDTLGWTIIAKAFARQAGWDVAHRVP